VARSNANDVFDSLKAGMMGSNLFCVGQTPCDGWFNRQGAIPKSKKIDMFMFQIGTNQMAYMQS
jgi:hypothetical protein